METQELIHRYLPGSGEVRVKLERGQKGGYGWEISVAVPRDGEAQEKVLREVDELDRLLRGRYSTE